MQAIDKAKLKYPALSRYDIIDLTCPDIVGLTKPDECEQVGEQSRVPRGITCAECWEREAEE